MNFNKFFLFHFALITMLFISCCKDDHKIQCAGEELPNADFIISQGLGFNEDRRYFESDTLLKGMVKVEAIHKNSAQYKWKIGSDPTIRTGNQVELDFDVTGDISVTLIVEWTPNLECFPDDDGRDTLTKTFHLIDGEETKVYGDFEGYYESKPDSLVTLYVEYDGFFSAYVNNIPLGCFEDDVYLTATYRSFFIPNYDAKFPCPRPKGWGNISNDNKTLTLEYEIWDLDLSKKVSRKFIGIRK